MSHLFISYSRKDQAYARKLAEAIRSQGFDVWIDDRIDYGERWWKTIVQAIEAAAAFVIVMSPDAEASEWVEREILLAQRTKKAIFPLLLKGKEFSLLISTQFVDVRDGRLPPDDFYQRLAQLIPPAPAEGHILSPAAPQGNSAGRTRRFLFRKWWLLAPLLPLLLVGLVLLAPLLGDTKIIRLGGETPTGPPSPLALAQATMSRNAEWTPYIQEFDGVEMVLVPAGCFIMGSENGNSDERSTHQQCFDRPFWIDRHEVTNAQYGSVSIIDICNQVSWQPQQPRNCLTWAEAHNFCASRGARLPTEAEWEYAARGPDALIYTWGNNWAPVTTGAVYGNNSSGQSAPVGSVPNGMSWVGAVDMIGNLWEWTSSIHRPYPYIPIYEDSTDLVSPRVQRGGSFMSGRSYLRASDREIAYPNIRENIDGFRCARDFDP